MRKWRIVEEGWHDGSVWYYPEEKFWYGWCRVPVSRLQERRFYSIIKCRQCIAEQREPYTKIHSI